MTLRIRNLINGSVDSFGNATEAVDDFEWQAAIGHEVMLTTGDGVPMATARQGKIEWRDPVLAGTPSPVRPAPMCPLDDEPSLEARPSYAYPIAAVLLILVLLSGAIASSGAVG